jgi:coproporphyrinogen III oxidase-like Fe-S oxidoreductase
MIVVILSVSDFAAFLGKSPQRVYQLIHDGLLEEVGITVYRTRKGRVWLRTIAANLETIPGEEERRLNRSCESAPSVCGRA